MTQPDDSLERSFATLDGNNDELFWTLYKSKAEVYHKDMFGETTNDLDSLLTFVCPFIRSFVSPPYEFSVLFDRQVSFLPSLPLS